MPSKSIKTFQVPEELIALNPKEPRDSSRLMVVHTATGTIEFDVFANIGRHLPDRALLVCNDTWVLPARVSVKKETGGAIKLLLLVNEFRAGEEEIKALAPKKLKIGTMLTLEEGVGFKVVGYDDGVYRLRIHFGSKGLAEILGVHGETPIPPYLSQTSLPERELREKYQTVFAERGNSAAAPTASLHFTERLLKALRQQGFRKAFVTLDVGMGTFAPVGERELSEGKLHEERFEITAENARLIRSARGNGQPVVAVGTTVVRALESAVAALGSTSGSITETTTLFIRETYRFELVDALITNFHVPESSLVYLVEAFLRSKKCPHDLYDLYARAVEERLRFYSFGDAMLIL